MAGHCQAYRQMVSAWRSWGLDCFSRSALFLPPPIPRLLRPAKWRSCRNRLMSARTGTE